MLNEACSSGCGSFIETFAKSLNLEISEFVKRSNSRKTPCRFRLKMYSIHEFKKLNRLKKEGYTVGDISSGLSYSVIKKCYSKSYES